MNDLIQRLEAIKIRYDEVSELIVDPGIIADMKRYVALNKEYKDLQPLMDAYKEYKNVIDNIESSKKVLATEKDEEFLEMAKAELTELIARKEKLDDEIKYLLIPKDPEDDRNAIVEIRAGTGGDEAGIFVGDLYRMYKRYCDQNNLPTELIVMNEGIPGSYKEISFLVNAPGAYGIFKFESGVHRVQRVPETEAQGRVHTSAVTVAVLPEAEEVDVQLNMTDVKKDVFRASGAGGQHVNKTESAVRLTHVPTGVVVECQEERSQIKNYEKALTVLRTRLFEAEYNKRMQERAAKRKTMVSTGDRSAKIRTYNYPQGRITDHRIGLTIYNLGPFMNGDIQEMIDALQMAENAEKLKEGSVV
ncbi:MAG TPA: peptide chain release factor 1 [Flavobacteriales bacterium]|nr:peptide chain release factor 1 [Flavobacteriales bacterium]